MATRHKRPRITEEELVSLLRVDAYTADDVFNAVRLISNMLDEQDLLAQLEQANGSPSSISDLCLFIERKLVNAWNSDPSELKREMRLVFDYCTVNGGDKERFVAALARESRRSNLRRRLPQDIASDQVVDICLEHEVGKSPHAEAAEMVVCSVLQLFIARMKRCQEPSCGKLLSLDKRPHAKFCDETCKATYHRYLRRRSKDVPQSRINTDHVAEPTGSISSGT